MREREDLTTPNGNGSMMGILVGSLVGAAVGASVALLYAPTTGKEARDWLARRTRELGDKAASLFEQGKEAARQEAKSVAAQGKDYLRDLR
jgi:gas vesicle protein